MTLKNVLKGHQTDKQIIITTGYQSLQWKGSSMLHMVNRYAKEWLDMNVKNTTKLYNGTTLIEL